MLFSEPLASLITFFQDEFYKILSQQSTSQSFHNYRTSRVQKMLYLSNTKALPEWVKPVGTSL